MMKESEPFFNFSEKTKSKVKEPLKNNYNVIVKQLYRLVRYIKKHKKKEFKMNSFFFIINY